MEALTCLQCWASVLDLPLLLMEPALSGNYFKALPQHQTVQFRDIFDIKHFNEESKKMQYAQFIDRDLFFKRAPYKVVFVNIRESNTSQILVTTLLPDESDICGCIDPLQINFRANESLIADETKDELVQLIKKGFCIVKVVDIMHQFSPGMPRVFTAEQMKWDVLGNLSYSDITLVFNYWRANFVVKHTSSEPESKSKCYGVGYHSFKHNIIPSPQLLSDVQYYEDHFLKSGNNITVMVRIEHIYTYLRGYFRAKHFKPGQWSLDKCLRKTVDKVHELQNDNQYGKPFLTMDIGRFGSVTWTTENADKSIEAHKYGHEFFSWIYGNSWSFNEWEKSFTQASRGTEDSGYIAALQRSLAIRADCLILVGGGSFHELALKEYMAYHRDRSSKWCIYFICSKNERDLQQDIRNYKRSLRL